MWTHKISIFGSVVKLELLPDCLFFQLLGYGVIENVLLMQIPIVFNDYAYRSELIRNNHDCIDISAGKKLLRGLCCRQEGESSQSPP